MRLLLVTTIMLFFCGIFQPVAAEEDAGKRFQALGDNIVLDSLTGLMWAARDNGQDIDWYDAQAYCKEFSAGGYSDWRMADIKELATLYTEGEPGRSGYFITDLIQLTDCCVWSSYETMGGSLAFSYRSGKRPPVNLGETYQLRALPVRSAGKTEAGRYDVVEKHAGMN